MKFAVISIAVGVVGLKLFRFIARILRPMIRVFNALSGVGAAVVELVLEYEPLEKVTQEDDYEIFA